MWRATQIASHRFGSIRSLEGLRALDGIAQRYGARPSALISLDDDLAAYQLDEAAALAGLYLERQALDDSRARAAERTGDKSVATPRRPAAAGGAELKVTNGGMTLRGKVPILWKNKPAQPTEQPPSE